MPESDLVFKDSDFNADVAFGVTFGFHKNLNVFCPFHEINERGEATSNSKSCSVNVDGMFHCKVCDARGGMVEFYAQAHGLSRDEAIAELTSETAKTPKKVEKRAKPTKRPLNDDLVKRCCKALQSNKYFMDYLLNERGLTPATIERREIGCDEYRITIPIRNAEGKVVNIRRYLPHADLAPKMVSHEKGDGSPVLYPIDVLERLQPGDELIVCEGEWDADILEQYGFNAITNTGNVGVWNRSWTQALKAKGVKIVVMFDVHDDGNSLVPPDLGQREAGDRCRHFRDEGLQSKIVALPLPDTYIGGDPTDWFVKARRTAQELRDAIDRVAYDHDLNPIVFLPDSESSLGVAAPDEEVSFISLHQAAGSDYFYKSFKLRALVAGKGTAPYLIPSKITVNVTHPDGELETIHKSFDAWDGAILSLIQCTSATQKQAIRAMLGIQPTANISLTVHETMTMEEVFLIPSLDGDNDQGPYALRRCFCSGQGVETNRVYEFTGYTLPDPRTQAATHVFVEAKLSKTSIDTFELTPAMNDTLTKLFTADDVFDRMSDIANVMASHVTKIYGRPDLHMAVDLVVHSPLQFFFDGVRVKKGWLEALIIGDTRTGKGFVTEGMIKHYGVGEVVSGENLSVAGLIGGVQKVGERWSLVWGKIPLRDGDLVVMDECGAMSQSDIGRLSRVRSEGVAEITKIISEKTTSRTRLIWLANPRPSLTSSQPRMIASYNYGIEAVPELIGAAEDVARFDYVLVVAQSEVDTKTINKHHKVSGKLAYTSEACRNLILWVWSRKPEQIIFEAGVNELILKAAQDLGRKFSPKVCLIQAEDVRYKLARIACAVAGRTFSTDDGTNLIVRKEHAEFAYNFLHHIYSKPCSGYLQLSTADRERSVLRDPAAVRSTIEEAGPNTMDLIDGLLENRLLTAADICDYANLDIYQARLLLSSLVRHRAITKDHNGYVKKPAFKQFLQELKSQLASEEHTTQEDTE